MNHRNHPKQKQVRNTFFSLFCEYHLLSKAFESDAVKETQQIKAFSLALSLTAVLMEETTDLGDELTAENTMHGGKKRLE